MYISGDLFNIFKNSILFSNIVLNGCMFKFGLVILYTFFQILFSYREGVMIKAQLDKDSGKTYKASDRLVNILTGCWIDNKISICLLLGFAF